MAGKGWQSSDINFFHVYTNGTVKLEVIAVYTQTEFGQCLRHRQKLSFDYRKLSGIVTLAAASSNRIAAAWSFLSRRNCARSESTFQTGVYA